MNKYLIKLNNDQEKVYIKSDEELIIDDLIVVETSRGEYLGRIDGLINKEVSEYCNFRKINSDDYERYLDNLKDEDKALKTAINLVKELCLDMHIINANFNLDRSQLFFNFTADERIDFRELAKKLASIYKTRIELRQIGARDKAQSIGGVGVCGGTLCCVRFLKNINTISMNMAKNQNLALNPNKINGSCGRLLCCLEYEDENYIDSLKGMPSIGDVIKTKDGEGQVVSLDILNRKCKVLIDGEKYDHEIDSEK